MENAAFWERMYAANIGRMIGACHRYVNDLALAEDLAHEAFLKAMERADTYRATGNFEAWLMRITVNHAIQHLRQSMNTVPFVEEETPDVAPEETSIWETDFTQEELLEAVQQLPVPQRTVFNLYAIDNQSHAHIADLLPVACLHCRPAEHLHRQLQGDALPRPQTAAASAHPNGPRERKTQKGSFCHDTTILITTFRGRPHRSDVPERAFLADLRTFEAAHYHTDTAGSGGGTVQCGRLCGGAPCGLDYRRHRRGRRRRLRVADCSYFAG